MHCSVFSESDLVGVCEIAGADRGDGVRTGVFLPAAGYEKVRHVFRLFSEAQSRAEPDDGDQGLLGYYIEARDRLGLTVRSEDGTAVRTGGVHILDDSSTRGGRGYRIVLLPP